MQITTEHNIGDTVFILAEKTPERIEIETIQHVEDANGGLTRFNGLKNGGSEKITAEQSQVGTFAEWKALRVAEATAELTELQGMTDPSIEEPAE